MMHEEIKKQLTEIAKRRYNNNKLRADKISKEAFKFEDGLKLLFDCYENGFQCYYCKKKLKIKDIPPYLDVPSIDHKMPLSIGGLPKISNCVVCCNQCNIIKGTLTENTFVRLLNAAKNDDGLLEKIFKEEYAGKLAYKIERLKVEKEILRETNVN